MEKLLEKLLDALWLKPISVPIAFVISLVSSLLIIPEAPNGIMAKQYALWAVFVIVFLIYTGFVIRYNVLPTAKKSLSVLFVIDAENEQFYHEVEKKLVSEFEDCNRDRNGDDFGAVCVSKSRLKQYHFSNRPSMIKLLCRVNCMFVVFVKHRVDSITNAENYKMQIDYGMIHPDFESNLVDLIKQDMCNLASPIRIRKFKKAANIDEMTFTAIALNVICRYLVGLVMLMSRDPQAAYDYFHKLKAFIKTAKLEYIVPGFDKVLDNRLCVACMMLADEDCNKFYLEKSRRTLEDLNAKLEEINTIIPNTYNYYQGKAYYHVAFNSDITAAKSCIKMCKQDRKQNSWRYSDAFISAYEDRAPMTIYNKYSQAFKCDHDLNRIVDYIEYILDKEPHKHGLHLAAGLVYNEIEQKALAKEHFDAYFSTKQDEKIIKIFKEKKIWALEKVA